MTILPTLTVELESWSEDCDDCGSYWSQQALVRFADGRLLAAVHDGHLGMGNWSGEYVELLSWILASLGYEATVDGECPLDITTTYVPLEGTLATATPGAPLARIAVTWDTRVSARADCFEYTVAVRASWQSLAGETRTLDFENGGDDLSEEEAWERVLDALIRERAQVEVHAKPGYRPA